MKKTTLLLSLCLMAFMGWAQTAKTRADICPNCIEYDYPEFKVIKDNATFQTVIEQYTVIGDSVKKGVPQFARAQFSFHADPGQQDMTDDYYKSGFAIGHVNSAKNNAAHKGSLKHSMLWINTNLQKQSMNAGPWLGVENHERDEAVKNGTILVKAGVYGNIGYTKGADTKHNHSHHATIPAYWWKALCYKDSTVVWVMPNIDMPQHTADYTKPQFKKSLKFLTDTVRVNLNAFNK